jgi:hypothetical protein
MTLLRVTLRPVSQSQTSTRSQTTARTQRRRNRAKPNHRRTIRTNPPRIHVAAAAIHCDTGQAVEYRQLLKSTDGPLWEARAVEEWARVAQGLPSAGIPVTAGTNSIRFISRNELPPGRTATYPHIVVADRPQKKQTKRVRITVVGDRIDYPGIVATKAADLATVKLLLNSVISTPAAEFMTLDIQDFYLNTPMKRAEYVRVALRDIPKAII